MQYIDIYQDGAMFARVQLSDVDLMDMPSSNWKSDVEFREQVLNLKMDSFFKDDLITRMSVKNVKYYLVFESRLNKQINI